MSEPFLGMRDITLTYDGDLVIVDNDLGLTTGIDYIEREIIKLLISRQGDWKNNPSIGCSPGVFRGDENTRETGEKIKTHLENGLRLTTYPGQAVVKVVPTSESEVMIFIDLYVLDTNYLTIPLEFDYMNGFTKFNRNENKDNISSISHSINDIVNTKRPNKYWDRMREQYNTL